MKKFVWILSALLLLGTFAGCTKNSAGTVLEAAVREQEEAAAAEGSGLETEETARSAAACWEAAAERPESYDAMELSGSVRITENSGDRQDTESITFLMEAGQLQSGEPELAVEFSGRQSGTADYHSGIVTVETGAGCFSQTLSSNDLRDFAAEDLPFFSPEDFTDAALSGDGLTITLSGAKLPVLQQLKQRLQLASDADCELSACNAVLTLDGAGNPLTYTLDAELTEHIPTTGGTEDCAYTLSLQLSLKQLESREPDAEMPGDAVAVENIRGPFLLYDALDRLEQSTALHANLNTGAIGCYFGTPYESAEVETIQYTYDPEKSALTATAERSLNVNDVCFDSVVDYRSGTRTETIDGTEAKEKLTAEEELALLWEPLEAFTAPALTTGLTGLTAEEDGEYLILQFSCTEDLTLYLLQNILLTPPLSDVVPDWNFLWEPIDANAEGTAVLDAETGALLLLQASCGDTCLTFEEMGSADSNVIAVSDAFFSLEISEE